MNIIIYGEYFLLNETLPDRFQLRSTETILIIKMVIRRNAIISIPKPIKLDCFNHQVLKFTLTIAQSKLKYMNCLN